MAIDENTYELIDRYLQDLLSAEERTAFESRLEQDSEFREETGWMKKAVGVVNDLGRDILKKQISAAISGVPSSALEKYRPSLNGKSFLQKWWWAITCGAVVLIAAVLLFLHFRHPAIPEKQTGDRPLKQQDTVNVVPPIKDSVCDSMPERKTDNASSGSARDDEYEKRAKPGNRSSNRLRPRQEEMK
ncbi:MAG TPA: hypothetical protein VFU15_12700 [Bacteroidia bacterium]|nr:hypothetical protein [Bacteroidia bacterium]